MHEAEDARPERPWGPTLGGAHWDTGRLGTLGDRFIGYLIDAVVLFPVMVLGLWFRNPHVERTGGPFGDGSQHLVTDQLPWWGTVLLAIPTCAYVVATIALMGATLGQRSKGLRVVDRATGDDVSWRAAATRWAVVSGPPLVVALVAPGLRMLASVWVLIVLGWMFRDRDRQGLHDKAAGVVVVRDPARVHRRS